MPRKISLPTMQQIEAIASSGDVEQLRTINERLAKTANQRMRQLEKTEGMEETAAYKNAKYYLWQESEFASGGVFSRSKKLTEDQLTEQIEKELIFLRSQTSTVSGERARRKQIYESLTEPRKQKDKDGNIIKDAEGNDLELPPVIDISGIDISIPSDYQGSEDEYFQDKFLQFLDEDVWKDVKKYLYAGNNDLLQEAGEAMARGADINDLTDMYKDFLQNEITIYDMWDKWTSVK